MWSYIVDWWWLSLICLGALFLYYYHECLVQKFWSGCSNQYTPELPPMKRRDMTREELKQYDGKHGDRVCVAVNGNIYDVSTKRNLYGPGGPYGLFAGRDASLCLAKFTTDSSLITDNEHDLSDLTPSEMNVLNEWTTQFSEMYPCIGRLLGPNDQSHIYTDDEEDDDEEEDHPSTRLNEEVRCK